MAHEFKKLVLEDGRFEVVAEVIMGLVCFRLKVTKRILCHLCKSMRRCLLFVTHAIRLFLAFYRNFNNFKYLFCLHSINQLSQR